MAASQCFQIGRGVTRGAQFPGAKSLWGRRITAGCTEGPHGAPKSPNNVTSTFFTRRTFASERPQVRTWGPKLASCPWFHVISLRPSSRCIRDVRCPLIGDPGIKWCLHHYSCILLITIPPVTDVHMILKKIECEKRVCSTKRSQGKATSPVIVGHSGVM